MYRIRHFIRNTGTRDWIQSGLLILGLCLMVLESVKAGNWMYTVPIVLSMFLLTYAVRHQLVKNLRTVQPVMNGFAIVAILAAFLFRDSSFSNAPWFYILVVALVSAYLGAYFWLVSDPRIVSVR